MNDLTRASVTNANGKSHLAARLGDGTANFGQCGEANIAWVQCLDRVIDGLRHADVSGVLHQEDIASIPRFRVKVQPSYFRELITLQLLRIV